LYKSFIAEPIGALIRTVVSLSLRGVFVFVDFPAAWALIITKAHKNTSFLQVNSYNNDMPVINTLPTGYPQFYPRVGLK